MIIIDGKNCLPEDVFTKIVIGKFDGVHAGHRKLILDMINSEDNLKPLVFTFSFDSSFSLNDSSHIYSEEERRKIFEGLGVEYLVEYVLNKESAAIEPEDFVREVLSKTLHAKAVYCGPDLSFGNRGMGNIATIESLSEELDIRLHVIKKEKYLGEDISSTRIRDSLKNGDRENAEAMLGRKIMQTDHIIN